MMILVWRYLFYIFKSARSLKCNTCFTFDPLRFSSIPRAAACFGSATRVTENFLISSLITQGLQRGLAVQVVSPIRVMALLKDYFLPESLVEAQL